MPELRPRRAPRPLRQRAGPALVGTRHRHERVPPLLVGSRAARIFAFRGRPDRRPFRRKPYSPNRDRGCALRPLPFLEAVPARFPAVSRWQAAATQADRTPMGARAQAGRRVLRSLPCGSGTAVQRTAPEQSGLPGNADRPGCGFRKNCSTASFSPSTARTWASGCCFRRK